MNKEEILAQIRLWVEGKEVTKEEILATLGFGAAPGASAVPASASQSDKKHVSIAQVLYYIGGAIVFLGIAVLIGQNWNELPTAARILVTLGSGVAAYIVGVLLSRNEEKLSNISGAFFMLSALLMPFGMGVAFHEAGWDVGMPYVQTLISFMAFAIFFASFFAMNRRDTFLLFSIIFGTWFFISFTGYLSYLSAYVFDWHFGAYRMLAVGLTYLLLGYAFTGFGRHGLVGPLYSFGSIFFLGSTLALGGWQPEQNVFWELIYPALVFGIIFGSVYLRSKALLTFGSLFLMGYILKLTGEYFKNSMGWAFSLVVAGLGLMAVGYLTVYLNQKYLKKAQS